MIPTVVSIFLLICFFHSMFSIIVSVLQILDGKNYEYDIESLQIENELLRQNIKRLEKIIQEKDD